MRWFRRPPDRAWSRLVATGQRASPMAKPPPTPRELVSVVGVGHTETVGSTALTLLSLERYREADVANFRLTHRRGLHLDFPSPELSITVTTGDDAAPRHVSMMGGSGGGNGQELVFRYSYSLSPPIPEDATEVIIEVSKIEWVRHGRNERRVASVDAGPWRFTIKP